MNSKDVIICVLPLFHIYSLNSVLLCGLRVGAAILILQKYDMSSLLRLIQIHKATIAPFVPPIVLDFAKNPDIHNYDLSSIRIVMSGAAPMGKDLEDTVKARLPNAILGQVIYIQLWKTPIKVYHWKCLQNINSIKSINVCIWKTLIEVLLLIRFILCKYT